MITTEKSLAKGQTRRLTGLEGLSREEQSLYDRIPEMVEVVKDKVCDSPMADELMFGEQARQIAIPSWTHFPEVPEEAPVATGGKTRLNGRDEAELFHRYNYARYRLSRMIAAQNRRRSLLRARKMLLWHQRVIELRAGIVRANMALVVAMAKRTRIPNVEFAELVSEGNMALLRSVEKFDVGRGFKFSTYACRAILKSYNRLATRAGRLHQHFPTEYDPSMEQSDYDVKKHEMQRANSVDAIREILARNKAGLSDLERKVVIERFAIATEGNGKTLSEVGRMIGLTNERVRQIQKTALEKIRSVLDEEYLAV